MPPTPTATTIPALAVNAGPDRSGEEGILLSFDFAVSNLSEVASMTIAWGDGSAKTQTVAPTGSDVVIAADHVYVDDGSYELTVTVDDGANAATDSALVTIANLPPQITLGGAATVEEGSAYLLEATIADPGVEDVLSTCSIVWDDGSAEGCFAGARQYTHVYADDGTYTITLSASDDAIPTMPISETIVVTTTNVAPTFTFSLTPSQPVAGDDAVLAGALDDPGALDAHTVTVDWDDGSPPQATTLPANTLAFELSHRWDLPGTYQVQTCVEDDDGGAACDTIVVNVEDLVAAVAGRPYAVDEGGSSALDAGGSTCRDDLSLCAYEWDVGDDGAIDLEGINPTFSAAGYDGPSTVVLRLVVTTPGDASSEDTTIIEVANVAPALTTLGVTPANPQPAEEVTLTATFTDPGTADTHSAVLDWGDGSALQVLASVNNTITRTYYYTDTGVYSVTLTVTDDDGGVGSRMAQVNVGANAAPQITDLAVPADPVSVADQPITISVAFADPDPGDTHTMALAWGDGSSDVANLAASPQTFNHVYDQAGAYTVTAIVTDSVGATDSQRYNDLVVYDPDDGPVAGLGLVVSEAGWCNLNASCADAEGLALFAFSARYRRDNAAPTGALLYTFPAGDFTLAAADLAWLVVEDGRAHAQFAGSGYVNGAVAPGGGLYRFIMGIGDGGRAAADAIRLLVWYEDAGVVQIAYDTGTEQPLVAGNVTILR